MEGATPQGSLTLPAPKIPAIPPRSSVICQDEFIYFFSLSWTRHINVSNITRALILNKSNCMLMKCGRGILIRTQMLADNISEQLRTCALSLPKTGCNQKMPKKCTQNVMFPSSSLYYINYTIQYVLLHLQTNRWIHVN